MVGIREADRRSGQTTGGGSSILYRARKRRVGWIGAVHVAARERVFTIDQVIPVSDELMFLEGCGNRKVAQRRRTCGGKPRRAGDVVVSVRQLELQQID